jgi:hypothetical protein
LYRGLCRKIGKVENENLASWKRGVIAANSREGSPFRFVRLAANAFVGGYLNFFFSLIG